MRGLNLGLGFSRGGAGSGETPVPVAPFDPPVSPSLMSSVYHVFGLDRLVHGYSGSTARMRRLSDNAEQDFGFDPTSGAFDIPAVNAWRAGADVDLVSLYDQRANGSTALAAAGGTVAFMRSGTVQRFGCSYDDTTGLLSRSPSEGGVGVNLAGTGHIAITNTTIPVSTDYLEINMLWSLNTRKLATPASDVVTPPGNNAVETYLTYGTGNNNYSRFGYNTTFGTYTWFDLLNSAVQNDNGSGQIMTQYGQSVLSFVLDNTKYIYKIYGVESTAKNLAADSIADVTGGSMNNGIIAVGASFSNGTGGINTSGRGDFLFGGIIVSKKLPEKESWLLQSRLGAVGQQHRIKSAAELLEMLGDVHFMKDVDGGGLVVGAKGNVNLQWATSSVTTDFNYTEPLTGLRGIRVPDSSTANGFRANNNYMAGKINGTILAFHVPTINNVDLAYVFGMNSGAESFNTGNRFDGTTAIGRDHSPPALWSSVAAGRRAGSTVGIGSRSLKDGTEIGDAAGPEGGNQPNIKYNNKVTNAAVAYPKTIGAYSYTEAGFRNQDPAIPDPKKIDAPTGYYIKQNVQGFFAYNNVPILQIGTFEAPNGYNRADSVAARQALFLSSSNKQYMGVTGAAIGHVHADIAHNPYGCVNDSTDDALIGSNFWYGAYRGTRIMQAYIPDVVWTKRQCEEFQVNHYKFYE